jgi:hypothetical protein
MTFGAIWDIYDEHEKYLATHEDQARKRVSTWSRREVHGSTSLDLAGRQSVPVSIDSKLVPS